MITRLARTVVALVVVVTAGAAASGHHRLYDVTEERALTLTDQTLAILGELDRDVEITAFLRRDEPGRVEAATLLDRYAKANRRITWDVVDPDDAPGEVARLGVDPVFGGLALRSGEQVERVPAATEQDVTAGLARLVRGRDTEVCLSTGHGEPTLAEAAALLEREGHRIHRVDLLAQPSVPATCTAFVLAGPAVAPGDDAVAALARWTADDGKLLVLADPVVGAELDALLEPFGLGLQHGLVIEGDPEAVIAGDVLSPIVRTYSSAHPIVRRLAPTYFPAVQGVAVADDTTAVSGLIVSRLADTSPSSYLETEPVAAVFDPDADEPGPITVAAAADRTSNDGTRIRRSRVVVVGDADFATDRYLGEAANATLLVRAVAWLALEDDVVALSANLPADRPLRLTDGRLAYARLLTAGVVPALFLLAGSVVWAVRRGR